MTDGQIECLLMTEERDKASFVLADPLCTPPGGALALQSALRRIVMLGLAVALLARRDRR